MDPQRYPVEGLVKDSLKPVQGPALLAWNNATFKEEDWSNIGKLYQSKKMEDKMKVGRFGIGFQSVHHITGIYEYALNVQCMCHSGHCVDVEVMRVAVAINLGWLRGMYYTTTLVLCMCYHCRRIY